MKAVIVEVKDGYAAVLSDDGCIETIKNKDYVIGQVIKLNTPKIKFTKQLSVFAASAAAVALLSVGTWAYASPYTYVSVDVNPSIEYSVNRFDRVLTVKAVNDDGDEILEKISLNDLKNQTIEQALKATVSQIAAAGYFNGEIEGGLIITTSSKDDEKAEELAITLEETATEKLGELGEDVVTEALSVGLERVEEARELGVTPGKLNLVEKLIASSSAPNEISTEEWLNKSVKDIMQATKNNKKASVVSSSAITLKEKEDEKSLERKEEKQQKEIKKSAEKEKKEAEKALKKEAQQKEKVKQAKKKAEQAKDKKEHKIKKAKEKAKDTTENSISKSSSDEEKAKEKTIKAKEKSAKKAKEAKEKEEEKAKEAKEKSKEKAEHAKEKTKEKVNKQSDKEFRKDNDYTESEQGKAKNQDTTSEDRTDEDNDDSSTSNTSDSNNGNSNGKGNKNK